MKCDWLPTNTEDACNNICSCWKYPQERKISANCSSRNHSYLPSLVGKYNDWTIELNVSGNAIKFLPNLTNDSFKNIKLLDLSNNNISSISTNVFSGSLQVLKLHDNQIPKLDSLVIEYLKMPNISLKNLTLYGNPLECDCDAQKLTQIPTIIDSVNVKSIFCNNYNELLFKVNFPEICPNEKSFLKITDKFSYIIFGLLVIISLIILISFLLYYYRHVLNCKTDSLKKRLI